MSHDAITEPEQAAKALRQESDFIAAVLNTVGALVVVLDRQGRIVRFNQACAHTTGYAAAEVLGKTIWEMFLLPEEVEPVKEVFHRLRSVHFPSEHENYWVAKDGRRRLIAWTNTTILGDDGEVEYVIGTGLDITAQKQAQVEIASLSKFPAENPNPILRLDRDGTLLYANPSSQPLLDLWGVEIGQTLPEDWRQLVRESLSTGRSKGIELPCGEAVYSLALAPIADMDYVNIYGEDITERKQAEEALRESEQRFKAIFDNATDGFMLVYQKSKQFYLGNAMMSKMLGYSLEELRQMGIPDLHYPEDLPYVLAQFEMHGRGEIFLTPGIPMRRKDGSVFYAEINAFPLTLAGKTYLMGMFRDITERKQAEEALLKEKTFSDTTIDSLPGVFYLFDEQGKLFRWNENFQKTTGYSDAEISGMQPLDFVSDADKPKIQASIQEVFQKGEVTVEADLLSKDGRRTPYFFTGRRITLDDKPCLVGMGIDITARRRAEAALLEAHETLEAVIQSSPLAVISLNLEGHIQIWNPAAEEIFGWRTAEVMGRPLPIIPEDKREEHQAFRDRVQRGESFTNLEVRRRRKDGSLVDLSVSTAPLRDAQGRVCGSVGLSADVTARKQTEAALQESEKLYRSLFENMLNGFAYCKVLFDQNQPQDFISLEVNSSFEALTGLKNVVGKKASEVLPGLRESDPELFATFGRVALTGKAEKFEIYVEALRMWVAISVYSPEKEYFVAVFDVITERKQAEEELAKNHLELQESAQRLEQSRNMLQLIIESIPDRVFWKDRDLRFLGCNTLFALDAGLNHPQQLLGKDDFAMGWREQANLYRMDDRQVMESRRPKLNIVEPQTTPAGAKIWLKTSKVPLQMPNGEVFGVLGVYEDITAQKQAEEALLKYEFIANTSKDCMTLINPNYIYEAANAAFCQAHGKTREEVVGTSLSNIWGEDSFKNNIEGYLDRCFTGQTVEYEGWFEFGKRGRGCFNVFYRPYFNEDGTVAYAAVVSHDITERKQAEEALRKTTEALQALVQASPLAIFVMDTEGRVQMWNPASERIFGWTAEEVVGQVLPIIPEEKLPEFQGLFQRCLEGESLSDVELRRRRKDGSPIDIRIYNAPLYDPQGRVTGVMALNADITLEKQAEEELFKNHLELQETAQQLEQSRNMLQLIIESIPVRVFWKDRDLRYLGCNTLFALDAGFSHPQQLLRQDAFAMSWREQADLYRMDDRQVMESRRPKINIIEPQTTPAGAKIWLKTSKVPLQMPNGEVFGVLGVYEDITIQKQAEEALRKTTEALEAIIQASPLAIFVMDPEGRVQMWNPASVRIFGWTAEEAVGQVLPIVPEENLPEFRGLVQRCIEGDSLSDVEARRRKKDGSPIDIRIYNAPLYDPQGRVTGIMSVLADITLEKQAEEALKRSEATLRGIFMAAPIGIGLVSKRILGWTNEQLTKMTGYTANEFRGQSARLLYESDEEFERVGKFKYGEIRERGLGTIETRWRRKDGGVMDILLSSSPIGADSLTEEVIFTALDITERKRARMELFREKEKYRILAEESPLGVAIIGQDGNFKYLNPKFMEISGYTLTDLPTEKEWFARAFPDAAYRRQVISDWNGDLKESEPGESRSGTFTFTCKDGLGKIIHFLSASLVNRDKLIIYEDITERTRAEAAFESLVSHAPIGIYIVQEGKFRLINPGFEKITGYRVSDLIGEESLTIVAPEFKEIVRQKAIEMLEGKSFTPYEYQFLKKQGDRGWVMERVTPTEFEGKKATLGYFMDTTDRRQAEAALERLQLQHKMILNSAGEGIFGLDSQGKIAFINTAAEDKLGYTFGQLLGQDLHDLVHHTKPDHTSHPKEECPVIATLRDGEVRRVLDDVFWTKEGRGIPTEYVATPIKVDGKLTGVVVVFQDVSERKELESQFLQAQKMEAVGRLAGGVAHDFNNMLGAIIGYADMILMAIRKDDPIGRQVEGIKKAADRAASLTRQLLAFSRKQILHPQVLDLNAVVTDLENMLQRMLGEDIDMTLSLDPELAAVKADLGQMEQVVMNLAVNARDAMPQGGKLTIETANVLLNGTSSQKYCYLNRGPYVLLVVSDNGVGMDPETQAHIFEPFYTTKELGRGTGLGLSTVYGIVNQSNGYIEVYSEPGAGTTFKIYLPRAAAAVTPVEVAAGPTMELEGRETILVVEDEEMLQELIVEALRHFGYQTLAASNGGEALLLCERHPGPIQLMVTDVVMPQMSGRELAERLAPLRPQMKVLYISGYAEDAILQPGVSGAELPLLEKPFSPMALVRRVRELLDTSRD